MTRGTGTTCARPAAAGPVGTVTAQIDDGRRREAEQATERGRLRAVVQLLDEVIEACEEEHLDGGRRATPALVRQARAAIAAATTVLAEAGEDVLADDRLAGAHIRITEVQDVVWEVLDVLLDLLIPARRRLSDAIGPETPTPLSAEPALRLLRPTPRPQGCAYCGRRCERQDATGVHHCSPEHLLRARRLRLTRTTTVDGVGALTTSATGA
jgi:hypothetical protein